MQSGPWINNTNISCGVKELSELKAPRTCLRAVKRHYKEEHDWLEFEDAAVPFTGPNAFFIFSDSVKKGKGQRLADYIKENNLGQIQTSHKRINPNSGNAIKVWIWSVNWDAVLKWKG